LDLDVYSNLDHIPLVLKHAITGSIRVIYRYCEVFGCIIMCLDKGRALISSLLDRRIRYSWSSKNKDRKLYLLAGGKSIYALEYLIGILKKLMLARNRSRFSGSRLLSLPICLNNTAYDLVRDKLLEVNCYLVTGET
jgi:hypothetical protein